MVTILTASTRAVRPRAAATGLGHDDAVDLPPCTHAPDLDAEVVDALRGRRLWVTGARGFLGGAAFRALRREGLSALSFDGDIRDAAAVRDAVVAAQPDVVIHFAAKVDASRDPSLIPLMDATNRDGALHVHSACAALGHSVRLVHVGTCEEYGPIPAPFAEAVAPITPASPYGRSKLAATVELLRRASSGGPEVVIARPFLTYGPGQKPKQLLPAAVLAALRREPFPMTRGEQSREWNHVDDTVRGLLRACVRPGLSGTIVNVACGEERRVVDMARLVFAVLGAPAELLQVGAVPERPAEVPRFFAETSRCTDVLGHRPRVPLEDGIRATARWYAGALGMAPAER